MNECQQIVLWGLTPEMIELVKWAGGGLTTLIILWIFFK